ncbi:MAG: transglycosylase family protein [Pseudonocardia sp.]
MTGRHRGPDRSNRRALAGVGALGLVLGAPLSPTGVAAAAPAASAWLTPEDHSDDDGDDLDRYRERRSDARERARERAEDENRGAPDRGASVRERTDDDRADRRSRDRDDRARGRDGERAERHPGERHRDDRHRDDRHRAAGETSSGSDIDDSGSASDSDQQDARWDRLAECESSQNWEADTGNGYKGGLQFSESTWREHGGREYAPSADQASREEQIEVAKEVQREQGWEAWPSCSEKLGYT